MHILFALKRILLTGFVTVSMAAVPVVTVGAATTPNTATCNSQTVTCPTKQICDGVNTATGDPAGTPCQDKELGGFLKSIINLLLFVIGVIAVIMIIVGGIRYVVSGGDQSAITGAKNTILYAIVGLVVAILAFAIVNFVLASVK